ncbi:FecCD family ABC transporter permease [Streptomyces sp. NPDC091272]|uniref:FecCD family ABC transporter permease n=1 Tax=Streptomyces sp. NPDC091272 TaxID=3365981 RepID=UPI00380285B9
MSVPVLVVGLGAALLVSLVCGAGLGASGLGWGEVVRYLWAGLSGGSISADKVSAYTIVWELRFPRAVLAAVVGAGLAGIGVAVQAMVRNALADPFVLGISSGAAVGANAVLLFGALGALGVWALSAAAFGSALLAMALVYAIARTPRGLTPLRLVLTGTALYYGFSAITTFMVFAAERGEAARSAMMWLLGSLGGARVPHAVRMLVGADHRRLLAVAPPAGAVLLVWVDILSRTLLAPVELPVGVLTAAVGVPCFVLLMRRNSYTFGGV